MNCYIKKIVFVQSLSGIWLYYPMDCSMPGLPATVQKHQFFSPQGFPCSSDGKESACNAGDLGWIPGSGRSLQKNMATHCTIPVWKIPWTEELGRLQSIGLQRVRHDWATNSNSLLSGLNLTSVHDYWEECTFDSMKLSRQSDVSAF